MIPGVTPVPQNPASGLTKTQTKALGKDDFLKLLVAQLSAQDPLNPMEAQDFSAQLAQFSSLEQMTNVNTNLELIQKVQSALANSSSVNLIGKNVESPGNTFIHSSGSPEVLNYSLGEDASTVNIEIFDAAGNLVDKVKLGSQPKGSNQSAWDGFDSLGNPLPDGIYSFQVTGENFSGESILAETFSSGLVTDVIFEGGQTYAVVNGEKLPIGEIKRISLN